MSTLTPKEIVAELDRFIIGQHDAKRAVAVALRNRWRRMQLSQTLQEEVLPKNILMIGPTGVGKTEIARRLAKLAQAPFIKVEATKFTEIGYVGRDVEQIIRDLTEISIHMTRESLRVEVAIKAKERATERVLDALVGETASPETRSKFEKMLASGSLNEKEIEIQVSEASNLAMPTMDIPGMPGAQMGMLNLGDIFGKALGGNTRTKDAKMSVEQALEVLTQEESDKLLDTERVVKDAIYAVEQRGIVFIDEIDKICARAERQGGDVSREGVQRDLLPLIEGTNVTTKHGTVKTDHILFITSGAFHLSKPADLLPELQGRLPIRVELKALCQDDFVQILTKTEANLIEQSTSMMQTEGFDLSFDAKAIEVIAELAAHINQNIENIGARRLHTLIEKILEDISFDASEREGETFCIKEEYVRDKLGTLATNQDLSKFIL